MRTKRKGAVLPLLAVIMVALILVLGLMVELSWLYSSRFEAQSASDLAARSALARLYANPNDLDQAAIDDAKNIGALVYGRNFSTAPITANDLALGFTNDDKSFTELTTQSDFRNITASRVTYQQQFTPLLGTLVAKEEVNLPVFSVAEANRVQLVLCLDASRSMNRAVDVSAGKFPPGGTSIHEPPLPGSRWFALQDAVDDFLQGFEDRSSQLGLVTFGGGIDNPDRLDSPLDDEFARVELGLDKFSTNGPLTQSTMFGYTQEPALGLGTSIYDGLDESVTMLQQSSTPAKQYIILFTDGEQVAPGRPSEIDAGDRAATEGISVFTIAFSTNSANLKTISDTTGGQTFSVNTADGLKKAFTAIRNTLGARITQ